MAEGPRDLEKLIEQNHSNPIILARQIRVREAEGCFGSADYFYQISAGLIDGKLIKNPQKFDFSDIRHINATPGRFSSHGNHDYIFSAEYAIPVKNLLVCGNTLGYALPTNPECLKQAKDGLLEFGENELQSISFLFGKDEIEKWAKSVHAMGIGPPEGIKEFFDLFKPGEIERRVNRYDEEQRTEYFSYLVREIAEICLLEKRLPDKNRDQDLYLDLRSDIHRKMESIKQTSEKLGPLVKKGAYLVDASVIGIPSKVDYAQLLAFYNETIFPRLQKI